VLEHNISRLIRGVTVRGTYFVQGKVLTVKSALGSKSTYVLRGSKASWLAYVMLGELYHEAPSRAPFEKVRQYQGVSG
jgi:hypothetical protein